MQKRQIHRRLHRRNRVRLGDEPVHQRLNDDLRPQKQLLIRHLRSSFQGNQQIDTTATQGKRDPEIQGADGNAPTALHRMRSRSRMTPGRSVDQYSEFNRRDAAVEQRHPAHLRERLESCLRACVHAFLQAFLQACLPCPGRP
ncbi:hypothetical protein ABZ776_31960 [Streptomyces sp. NPDC007076]|uniref:hypothetical protein n=1 Tax=Streptomyces sp. NPDC007076 TaxID=3160975 RepID=UPI0033D19916